jgi:hypothetical protein
MFSWTHGFLTENVAEIDYIKSQFGNGLYAPLMFSNFYSVEMDWNINPADSSSGTANFKATVDQLVTFAKQHKVGMHLTINYGLSRLVTIYNDAKIEDIRNAQWFNDNNLSSQSQQSRAASTLDEDVSEMGGLPFNNDHSPAPLIAEPSANSSIINKYVFTTYSRYARKLRAHLEAKVASAFAYLTKVQNDNPDITWIVSAPGEVELNSKRIDNSQSLQQFFCDYSPFTVLEFRDWITHEGLYADGERYAGEGYIDGGSKYQGATGLAKFNADFGTSFTTWDLKYYNWSLTDAVDTDYTDGSNPDPNTIPVSAYAYNAMMPGSGSNYISGGFDPPRTMYYPSNNTFYDLWHMFRETLVYHFVKDMTDIGRASGFEKSRYYTHQIPGDYLFGTRPNDPLIPQLNPRYYSAAAPMWTADVYSDNGLGITLYDIKYPTWFARTTKYGIDGASSLSDNWAALEYHPEVIPLNINSTISSVSTIYAQMVKLYNGNPHVISFFKWVDSSPNTSEYRYKGNNRETAAKQFFDAIKDKARQPIDTMFTPKQVENFTGSYNAGIITLSWSNKIWTDLSHTWSKWGDFKEFAIYRGTDPDFAPSGSAKIVGTTATSYKDIGFPFNSTVYYKLAAINDDGVAGPMQTISIVTPEGVPIPVLSVSRDRLNFGYIVGGSNPPAQSYRISNTGPGALNWTATDDATWLSCTPESGLNGAVVDVNVDPTGLVNGTYLGTIVVSDPLAIDSPQTISVSLTVKSTSQAEKPFGSFDTPIEGSVVASSIAVTGWALDDTGIESVKLYRKPVQGEGNALVYVGDANFVEGARPDVETLYPDYPANYKAGWGYMLLTNFFPGGGNGSFTLHIKVKDVSGNEVTLGTKTINIDNNNAVKPFGAIDTPTQGGSASGGSFINWGWALTPQPSMIPIDGSTLDVVVDGVKIGKPTYNIYRDDIATLFPTYANSNGAVGYFFLDTTLYSDGIHTVQWTAKDNNGNTDGIGSRYFTVQNSGNDARQSSAKNVGFVPKNSRVLRPGIKQLFSTAPAIAETVRVRTGYDDQDAEQLFKTGKKGSISLEIRELERVVISPGNGDNTTGWTAFQVVGKQARELPLGSTFNPRTGTLYWAPAHGFIGEYLIRFVSSTGSTGQMKPKAIDVTIKIKPRFSVKDNK